MPEPARIPSYVRSPGAEFLSSLAVDRALARYDLAGSVVHVRGLERAGLLTPREGQELRAGLRTIAREIADGTFPWRAELEDVHTNVELRLTELAGPVGEKLHTGRSRNDQVALDERLYLRAVTGSIGHLLAELEGSLLGRAASALDTPMPGYTHLQRAQPVSVAHWLLAHYWRFDRDLDRLIATAARANVSPLGAGALATSTLPLDPVFTAHELGFDRSFENSMDAVSDRDYFAEFLFDLALVAVHLTAIAEELVLFATREFGFVERSSALGSGSSLMPQKRNPDIPELIRGKSGRVVGDLVALLVTLKGLPLTYDRDLQEDKAPVLDAVATVTASIAAIVALVPQLQFSDARLSSAAADPELYATDRAEQLVAEGATFRSAHESVREQVMQTPPASAGPSSEPTDPRVALARRAVPGGPAPTAVAAQLRLAEARRAERQHSLSSLDRQVAHIEELLNEVSA